MKAYLVVASALVSVTGCRLERPQEARQVAPEMRFEDIQFRVYRGNQLESNGHARVANYRRDTTGLAADAIQIGFPEQTGRQATQLSARNGAGTARSRQFTAGGGVVAHQGAETGATDEAHYSGDDGMVRGDRPVTVTGPSYQLAGPAGFTLDPRTGVMEIAGGARVVAGGEGR
jgi:LPS export ABC transporter protein LptC